MANINNSFYTCSEEVGQEEKLTYSDYEKGIHVKSFIANNEKLPFASEEFNSYTANLSLQLVDNHMNQLREAYRVLGKDGIAGFTVWGKRESSTVFTFISKALAQAGIELPNPPLDSFHLGEDKQKLVEDAKKVGFKKAVTYYVTHYANYRDGEEAFEKLRNAPVFEHVPAEKMGLVKEKYIALFEEFQKENGGLAVNFDSLYLIAYK